MSITATKITGNYKKKKKMSFIPNVFRTFIHPDFKVILTMLITVINYICSHENNFSRRDVLVETLKMLTNMQDMTND